jgi:hypothetical protein
MAPAKAKPQKMSIGDFLADENYGSWADEMEDMPLTCIIILLLSFLLSPFRALEPQV